jgi:hypothetical protein
LQHELLPLRRITAAKTATGSPAAPATTIILLLG